MDYQLATEFKKAFVRVFTRQKLSCQLLFLFTQLTYRLLNTTHPIGFWDSSKWSNIFREKFTNNIGMNYFSLYLSKNIWDLLCVFLEISDVPFFRNCSFTTPWILQPMTMLCFKRWLPFANKDRLYAITGQSQRSFGQSIHSCKGTFPRKWDILYPFITFCLECVATTPFNVWI